MGRLRYGFEALALRWDSRIRPRPLFFGSAIKQAHAPIKPAGAELGDGVKLWCGGCLRSFGGRDINLAHLGKLLDEWKSR